MSHKDYTKFSNTKPEVKTVVEEKPVVEEKLEEVVAPILPTLGVVDGCSVLNVRAEPDSNARVIRKISVTTTVIIDLERSTDEFYNVCLADGVEGYCMKRYIKVE